MGQTKASLVKRKEAYRMYKLGMAYRDIAVAMGITESTARTYVSKEKLNDDAKAKTARKRGLIHHTSSGVTFG